MAETIKIAGELESNATGNIVTRTHRIYDEEKGKYQGQINAETGAAIEQLNNELDAVNSQDIVPVDSLPNVGTADPKKIYRVVGENSYTDYMVNAAGDGWKELAEFTFPGVDNNPTSGSNNLAKSGGIFNAIQNSPQLAYVVCDTAANVAAKTVALTGYILPSNGGSIKIKMTNANTADNATLQIGNAAAKPLYYAGQRASSTSSWEAGKVIEVYYDGTNYQANNVAGGGGDGSFDISAYNASNDTPAVYSSLSVALAAVPIAKRKGGMSVRFLQESFDTYEVTVEENLKTEPSGTHIENDIAPKINNGIYTLEQLSVLNTANPLPLDINDSEEYYIAVELEETVTYTVWSVTKITDNTPKYINASYRGTYSDNAEGNRNFFNSSNWDILFNKDILSKNLDFTDNEQFSCYKYNEIRYYCYYIGSNAIISGIHVYVEDVSAYNLLCMVNIFDTKEKALNAGTNQSIESSDWMSKLEYVIKNNGYLVIGWKNTSGSINDTNIENIKNIRVKLDDNNFISKQANIPYYPITKAKFVGFKNTNVEDALLDIINTLKLKGETSVYFKDMVCSQPINIRYRCTVTNPITVPITVSVKGNIPSGFAAFVQSNYTISDGQSTQVIDIENSGWQTEPFSYKFTVVGARYITLGFKKTNNQALSSSDIETIRNSGMYLVLRGNGGEEEKTDIISLNDSKRTMQYLQNAKRAENVWLVPQTQPLVLLHFSDIHADKDNLLRIKDFVDYYSSYIDDVIHTGDIIENLFSDSFSFWHEAEADNFLNCVGNHEYYLNNSYNSVTSKQVYDKFFADYIDSWNVVQPDNAAENGLNYYYKDYTSNKVRLIVIDNMKVTQDEEDWVTSVLNDARTKNLHVICAAHMGSLNDNEFNNQFNSLQPVPDYAGHDAAFMYTILDNIYDAIDDFIDAGGHFVGWINGHLHFDKIGTINNHPNQLSIHVAVSNHGENWDVLTQWGDMERQKYTKSQDCFNIIAIDTYRSRIKILRIGANIDRDLRSKGSLCYDYNNQQIIYSD